MKRITVKEVERISHKLARANLRFDEPIPDFKTRYPGRLESCLNQPFSTYAKKDLYETDLDKMAILFYLLVKKHPFLGGNKRVAITTLLLTVLRKGKWLCADIKDFHEFAVEVTGSKTYEMQAYLLKIKLFIKEHLIDLPEDWR